MFHKKAANPGFVEHQAIAPTGVAVSKWLPHLNPCCSRDNCIYEEQWGCALWTLQDKGGAAIIGLDHALGTGVNA